MLHGWVGVGGEGGGVDSKTASFYTRFYNAGITPHGFVDGFDRQADRSEDISLLD